MLLAMDWLHFLRNLGISWAEFIKPSKKCRAPGAQNDTVENLYIDGIDVDLSMHWAAQLTVSALLPADLPEKAQQRRSGPGGERTIGILSMAGSDPQMLPAFNSSPPCFTGTETELFGWYPESQRIRKSKRGSILVACCRDSSVGTAGGKLSSEFLRCVQCPPQQYERCGFHYHRIDDK